MTFIGWVPIDDLGNPYRERVKEQWFGQPSHKPPRIYQTEDMANRQSPISKSKRAYLDD